MRLILCSLLVLSLGAFAEKPAILLVLTNHAELGDTGKATGFYLSEAAHPHEVFAKNGHSVTLASPKGGFAPIDPKSLTLDDKANAAFWEQFGNGDKAKPGVAKTVALGKVDAADYGAIFFAGGHGSMWDFPDCEPLQKLTTAIYEAQGAVGAVCHGPAALVNVKTLDGKLLIEGKTTAVFTNSEEAAVGLTDTVPFLLQSEFQKAGAEVETAENFSVNAVRDGRLVTGQNPVSAKRAAELLLEAMADKQAR